MNIFQLTCFLTVAETLNFARSAERLNVTQPAVTHQIRSLEKELGEQLFIRDTHSVELTHAGHLLVEDARVIVTTSLHVQKQFESMSGREMKTFGIGCNSDSYLQCLPEILSDFAALYPEIHPVIHMETSPLHLLHLLEDGKVSIVFGIKDPAGQNLGVYKELAKSPIMCVCAADHPLASKKSVTKHDLQAERLILFDTTKSSFFAAGLQKEMMVGKHPNELFFCESTATAIILTKARYGVFFFPQITVPRDDGLAAIPIEDAGTESFGMYCLTQKKNKPLKDFISLTENRVMA